MRLLSGAYREHPELFDYYIKYKEDNGNEAVAESEKRVEESKCFYVQQISQFVEKLNAITQFYRITGNSYEEAMQRVLYLKDIIENKEKEGIEYSIPLKENRFGKNKIYISFTNSPGSPHLQMLAEK